MVIVLLPHQTMLLSCRTLKQSGKYVGGVDNDA